MNLRPSSHSFRRPLAALALLCSVLTLHCGGQEPLAPAVETASLSLSPSNPQIAMGTAQQFSLRALQEDGRAQELAGLAQWTLQDESGRPVQVAGDGFLKIERPGRYTVIAQLADRRLSTPISVTAATPSSVALSPRTPSVAKGSTLAFTAMATFSDGSTQDVTKLATWSVKDVTGVGVATIDTTGVMQARAVGSARITARYETRSSYTTATITPARLTGVVVSPASPTIAAGTNVRFSATGTYSDGSSADVSSQVTWSIRDVMGTGVASIDGTGTANGLRQGQAMISAELDALIGNTLMTVGPGVPVKLYFSTAPAQTPKGTTARFVATADLSDGGTQDVSGLVTWSATDVAGTSVASVAAGVVSGNNVGKATITASLRGLSVSSSFEVTPAALTAIQLSASTLTLFQMQTTTLAAFGVYSDGTRKDISATVDWEGADLIGTGVLSVAAGGKIVARNVGQARVTASQGGLSASATVEVKASTVTGLSVSPSSVFYFLSPVQLSAVASLMGGGSADVTNVATWTIDVTDGTPADWKVSKGLVTAGSPGVATVTATYMGVSNFSLIFRLF